MKIYKFDTLNSTNEFMKNNAKSFEKFDIVITKMQTEGKSRRGNTWFSDEGMALFTFLVKKEEKLDDIEYLKLPLLAGLAVIKGLEKFKNLNYMFKWTNDIYLSEKKLCGILVERVQDNFFIGIGININNIIPTELENTAISLSEITGEKYDITDIAVSVTKEFQNLYADFINGFWKKILSEINSRNYLKNKKISIKTGKNLKAGIAQDINDNGEIEILVDNELQSFSFGEILNEKIFIEK